MKVYVVESSFGQFDDQVNCVEGVYSDAQKAEEKKRYIESDILSKRDAPCLVNVDDDIMTDSEYELWHQWEEEHTNACEFNNCCVIEFELDK